MPRIQVFVDLEDEVYQACAGEAQRRGVRVETLVEQTVNELVKEFEHENRTGPEIPIVPC